MDKTDIFLIGGGILSALVIGVLSKKGSTSQANSATTTTLPVASLTLPTVNKSNGQSITVVNNSSVGTLPVISGWKSITPASVPSLTTPELEATLNKLQEKLVTQVVPGYTFIATAADAAVLTQQTGVAVKEGDKITPMSTDGTNTKINVSINPIFGNRR
jgi:hypothetical protein